MCTMGGHEKVKTSRMMLINMCMQDVVIYIYNAHIRVCIYVYIYTCIYGT